MISEAEKLRRSCMVESVIGTHTMEGLATDQATRNLLLRYKEGELTLDQVTDAMEAHALHLVRADRALASVA